MTNNRLSNAVNLSKKLLDPYLDKNTICLDMTLGNGYDTLYLANKCQYVYSFDVQKQAIKNSEKRLKNLNNYQLILDNHLNYKKYVKTYDIVIFNLGYLPGSNKEITTTFKTTFETLKKLDSDNLATIILLVVYPRHKEGMIEASGLNQNMLNFKNYYPLKIIASNDLLKPYILMFIKK